MDHYDEKPPPYMPRDPAEDPNAPLVHHYVPQQQPPPPPMNKGFIPPPQPMPPGYGPQTSTYPAYPNYGTTVTVGPTTEIVIIGGCPVCKCGVLENEFTCCGILCCLLFFPLGILCCIAMQRKRCSNCAATFG